MKYIMKKLVLSLLLTTLVSPLLQAEELELQLKKTYQQELMKDLSSNVKDLFYSEIQKHADHGEVVDKGSGNKKISYFSIINVIVNDALSQTAFKY